MITILEMEKSLEKERRGEDTGYGLTHSSAPVDIAQYARDVRKDTAELASYALSEYSASVQSKGSYTPNNLEGHLAETELGDNEDDATPHTSFTHGHEDVIDEISEPPSPNEQGLGGAHSFQSPQSGASALTVMLRNSSGSNRSQTTSNADTDATEEVDDSDLEDLESQQTSIRAMRSSHHSRHVQASERTPLIRTESKTSHHQRPNYLNGEHDLEQEPFHQRTNSWPWPKVDTLVAKQVQKSRKIARKIGHPSKWNKQTIWRKAIVEPAGFLPAVVLGALLNVLDALSYGMILFPLGEPLFEKLGPAGISMFYVSCIVSQLTFSFGGSIFKGGVGSEMIEVVPFFHKMAFTILATVGEENPKAVISTTITSYAISSMLTGLVFFLMGMFRFGYIVGFIPRHILIGCIGGVGWFLIATGLEVTARLDGSLKYNWDTLQQLFQANTAALWTIPLALGVILYRSSKVFTGKYYLPSFILMIPAVFYFFVAVLPGLNVPDMRKNGWVFAAPDADEPWWFFYTLYGMPSSSPCTLSTPFSLSSN